MSYTPNQLEKAISDAKSQSKERKQRKFIETVEISVGLRDIDLKNPSNRINLEALVPNDLGGNLSVAVFAEGDVAIKSKESGLQTFSRQEIEQLSKEPKQAKKVANQYAFFLAEPPLMGIVARFLGKILGPRGKMPKPIPPRVDLERFVERYNRTVQLRLKATPVINAKIGKANLEDEALTANANAIIQTLVGKLPKGVTQIKSVSIKTTMGPSTKVSKA
ncbi:MAG: 50S ribosomal protein L1 [Candidatus Hodarchaeales archaeon]|jgi:large subunit ribosomal protein L1